MLNNVIMFNILTPFEAKNNIKTQILNFVQYNYCYIFTTQKMIVYILLIFITSNHYFMIKIIFLCIYSLLSQIIILSLFLLFSWFQFKHIDT